MELLRNSKVSLMFLQCRGRRSGATVEAQARCHRMSSRKGVIAVDVLPWQDSLTSSIVAFRTDPITLLLLPHPQQDKRTRKFLMKRVGTLRRAKLHVDRLQNVIAEQRRAGH